MRKFALTSLLLAAILLSGCDLLSPPEPTPTATFTPEPTATFTPEPSATNTAEPAAVQPEFSLLGPPGWQQFTTAETSIWMPPSWQGGVPGADLERILEAMEEANPDFAQYAAAIRANPDAFLFWGYDLESELNFLTNINIVTERIPSSITVAQYIDVVTQQLPAIYAIISTDTYPKGGYQAGEIVSQVEIEGSLIGQITFILRGERAIYALTLTTAMDEFDQRIETFRQIFEYFELAPGL